MLRLDTQKWLDKAIEDETAFALLRDNGQWATASYHAQQAVEKFFKAALVEALIIPPRVHDLNDLLRGHPAYIFDPNLEDAADRLTPLGTMSRYPGVAPITQADIAQAEQDLQILKAWALAQIP